LCLPDDVRDFLVTTNGLAAWVCEIDGRLVGHIALHTVWSDEVAEVASLSLGQSGDKLGSISRLFVEPGARGTGLLTIATNEARERSLTPVLDVVTTFAPALALYERLGWTRLRTVSCRMPNGKPIDEYVYAARLQP
jgi:GNAT superfamily N-acetyltransferase